MNEIFKVRDAAKYLGCSTITIYRHAEKGDLPGHKLGSRWRFFRDELNKWLRSRRR
jgi:excisionase family DNA binding protein